jgi:hypothetical protein
MKFSKEAGYALKTVRNFVTVASCSTLLGFSFMLHTNATYPVKNEDGKADYSFQASNKQRSQPSVMNATILTRGETATTIFKFLNGNTYQATDIDSSGNITRKRQFSVTRNGNFVEMKSLDSTKDTYRGIISGNRIDNGIWFNPNDQVWFGTWTATLE